MTWEKITPETTLHTNNKVLFRDKFGNVLIGDPYGIRFTEQTYNGAYIDDNVADYEYYCIITEPTT